METRATRIGLWIWTALVVLFLHIPIVIIVLYAFNASNVQGWPITDWTTKWFGPAIHNGEMQQALILSLKAGALATGIALVLGTLAAFALYRASFFGRTMISFLFILPIALPGIITGMALNSYFTYFGQAFGLWTIVVNENCRPPNAKNEFSAMPVMIPGSAIGRMNRNETIVRPKNDAR